MWRGISACKEPHASHQSLRCLRRISSPSHRVLARTAGRVGDNARSPFPSLRCDAWPTWSGEALTFHFDPHAERSCCACAGWQSAAHCVWTRSAHPCPCFALTRTSVLDAGCPPQQTRRQRPSWNTTRKRSSFPSTKRRMKKSSLQQSRQKSPTNMTSVFASSLSPSMPCHATPMYTTPTHLSPSIPITPSPHHPITPSP